MAQRMTDAEPILAKSGVVIEKIDGWIYYGLGFPPGKPIFFRNGLPASSWLLESESKHELRNLLIYCKNQSLILQLPFFP